MAPVSLPVLEERFPVLLARALSQSDFGSIYRFQSLVVLLEIEQFDTDEAEKTFMQYSAADEFVPAVYALTVRMDDWCRRLEYACLSGKPLALLKDLSGQISTNISPLFSAFYHEYGNYPQEALRQLWLNVRRKNREESRSDDFPRRLYLLLLASVRLMQTKRELYREEIYSSGLMDPSLAMIVAFLHNYRDIAVQFNTRWQGIPRLYLDEILKVSRHKQNAGTTWLAFQSSPVGVGTVLPKDSYWKAQGDMLAPGYKLLSDMRLTQMSLATLKMVVMEKNKERYPEAALGYVTALKQRETLEEAFTPAPIGFCLRSPMLLLGEGRRDVQILFRLTAESLVFMNDTVHQIGSIQEISRDEALFKMLHDAFHLSLSTQEGWQAVENFYLRFEEGEGLLLIFRLTEDFPPIAPLTDENLPALRLLVNPTAWLFPYSWACRILVRSVKITVSVTGMRNLTIYNDLGRIDAQQAFSPFGALGERGAWLAFGSYEMACKPVSTVGLSFKWQHLPACNGGLKEYYRSYEKDIDNRSFRARIEQLRNRSWKPLADADSYYLFRTSAEPVPQKEDPLIEQTHLHFPVTENAVLPPGRADKFQLNDVRSGFYRLILAEPDMGFGTYEYRRLFADVMMYNSHARRKKPLPEMPLSLLMDALELSYRASEDYLFDVGSTSVLDFSYLRPLSNNAASLPDKMHPVPLLAGPEDEGNLLIGIRGACGENMICMYLDLELLQREVDHEFLPCTDWYYRDTVHWIELEAINVLRDDTGGLMHSGAVVLQFPFCITSEMIDSDGIFWICVGVHNNLCNCSDVRAMYLNVSEACPVQTEEAPASIPGLTSCLRVAPLTGVSTEENDAETRTRISERIAHRNRLLLPLEYEQMTLQKFPDIAKVKCFPGMDAKQQNRSSMVTLAAIHRRNDKSYPLCTDELLCRIEDCLRQYASPFVKIDLINPVYEEVTVFCGISLKKGEVASTVIQEVNDGLRDCIAPWDKTGEVPVFGYSFSLRDLLSRIKEGGRVSMVHGMKLLQVVAYNDGKYDLREYILANGEEQMVSPLAPWAILVPAARQYVKLVTEGEWQQDIEIGDFEIENTFVIK